jgi:hypothetical protein
MTEEFIFLTLSDMGLLVQKLEHFLRGDAPHVPLENVVIRRKNLIIIFASDPQVLEELRC